MSKIRLYLDLKIINIGDIIKITDKDFNYLIKVMRQKINDTILIFNGIDGEFLVKICKIAKKDLQILIIEKIADLEILPKITLAFAPVKNVRIDFVAAKACEMGVVNFWPIITQRTIVDKINNERFLANIKEACEQCGRNDVPNLQKITKLGDFFKDKNLDDKILILCDESGNAKKASEVLSKLGLKNKEIVILIGPEGGFSQDEFKMMYEIKNLYAISLGKRILRTDTAIISALALVNEFVANA